MELKTLFIQDAEGNIFPGANCFLYYAGTSALVPGLKDVAGLPLSNPFPSDIDGMIQVAVADGLYDLRAVFEGYDRRIRVQFLDAVENIAIVQAASTSAAEDADRAQAAADSAIATGKVYATTALGLASGNTYFSVPSAESAEYLILYQNVAGAAVEIKRYPSTKAITDIGVEDQAATISGLMFAVVDAENKRTWLECLLDGSPSAYSMEKLGAKLTPANAPTLTTEVTAAAVEEALSEVGVEDIPNLNALLWALVDAENNRTWLEVGLDGKPTQRAMDLIIAKLPGDIGGPAVYYQSGVKGAQPIASGPNITCWGDSMTAGAGGSGTTYPGVLQTLLAGAGYQGVVNNRGIGGENTVTITARAGGNPFIVLPVGGIIPATTTPFEITLQDINGYVPKPLMQGAASYTGRLGNVAGTFSRTVVDTVYTYYFTRAVAGAEVVANRPTPLYLDIGDQGRDDINLIWIGQNGPNDVRAIQDAKSIIQRMTALDKRFLVISKPGGTNTSNVDDAAWFAEFGRRFIPIRQYMVQYGLADAGIEPTAQDYIDMANGTVPTSLRFDGVHWLAPGYTILAKIVFDRLKELEWI